MFGVPLGEQSLIAGFDPIVELFDEAGAQLFHQRAALESREQEPERAEDDVGVDEIGAYRVVDARVLDFDCHV